MKKLLGYELRRLLLNKFFLGLLVVTGLYSYQVLSGDIVRGVAYTAPFSGWSYGAYMARILPLLLITLLFFITYLYTRAEQRVATMTDATPMDPRKYRLVRYGAMGIGFLLITGMAIAISLVFYARVFSFTHYRDFLGPMLLAVVPALLLVFGLGIHLGRIHVVLLYVLMLLLLALGQDSLPAWLDIFGTGFFMRTPLTLPYPAGGEPVFTVPATVWLSRVGISAVGAALIGLGIWRGGRLGQKGTG